MTEVTVTAARDNLYNLVKRASKGNEVLLTLNGKVIAAIIGYKVVDNRTGRKVKYE